MRTLFIIMAFTFCFYNPAEAGWLEDKLKKAQESVGTLLDKNKKDRAYEERNSEASDSGNQAEEEYSGRYDAEKTENFEQQEEEESAEYLQRYRREEMGQPSWAEPNYERKSRKKKKTGPQRTDLHLTSDMLMNDPESSPEPFKGKIYLDGTKSRMELNYPDGNSVGIIVTGINPTDKVYILMHSQKSYMESSADKQDDNSFSFVGDKPCEGFLKAQDLGKTTLNGRRVAQWRCSEPEDPEDAEEGQDVMTIWFDNTLKIPIRMENENSNEYWELSNLREGRPSTDVFKLPSDYRLLSVGGAIPAASSLSDRDAKKIKGAGIPLFSKANFVYGNSSVGFRFASREPVETVRSWYNAKLSSWSVYNEYGSWILYNGKPGLAMSAIMSTNQVSIQQNDKLPEWHALDEDMTTEIVIMIPR